MQSADKLARAIHDHRVRSAASDLLFQSLRPEELSSPKGVCMTLSALARGVYNSDSLAKSLVNRFTFFQTSKLNEQDIGLFFNACSRLAIQPTNFQALLATAIASADDFKPQGLSNLLNALSKLDLPIDPPELRPLVDACNRATFSNTQLATVVQALAKFGIPPSKQLWSDCDKTHFDAQSSSMVLDALARVDASSISCSRLLVSVRSGGDQEVGVALIACARLRLRDESFLNWWCTERTDLHHMSTQSLCNAALAFARLDWAEPIEGLIKEILGRNVVEVQHIGQAIFACAVADLPYLAQLLNRLPECKDVADITFALEVQVVTALLNSDMSLESLSDATLRLLQSFRVFSPRAAELAAAETHARTSRLHADVRAVVSNVIGDNVQVTDEVFQMPYFIDLVVRLRLQCSKHKGQITRFYSNSILKRGMFRPVAPICAAILIPLCLTSMTRG